MLLIFGKFLVTSANSMIKIHDEKIRAYILGLLMCIACILGTSFFMVVLEGPYMGIFIWVCMGMVIALNKIYFGSLTVNSSKSL
jgi:hypothetical protein